MIYRTVKYLETGELMPEPTVREKIDVCIVASRSSYRFKGENVAVREMRKHAAWYLKGIRGNGVSNVINACETA